MAGGGADMTFRTATWAEVCAAVGDHARRVSRARLFLVGAIVLLVAGALADVTVPILLGRIVDAVAAGEGAGLALVGAGLAAAALAGAGLSAAGFFLVARVSERVIATLRERMLGTALTLPADRVEEPGSGDVVSRATDDVAELSAAVSAAGPALVNSTFSLVVTSFALVGLDWQFVAVVASAGPLYAWGAHRYLRVAPRRYAAERAAVADRARTVIETAEGRETIRAFGWEDAMRERAEAASWEVVERGYAARRTMMTLQLWITFVQLVMLGAGLVVGFVSVGRGDLSIGTATAAMFLLIRVRGPLLGLMRVLDTAQAGYASLARIVGVLGEAPREQAAASPSRAVGEVRVENATMSYGSGWAVRGIDMHLRPGETVALVGASGAGKSTVAALVAGMRTPDHGRVTVDGVAASQLADAHSLTLISQETHVFAGTLRENLALGAANARATDARAADADMRAALERVGAGQWVSRLTDGLDTVVGEGGFHLDAVRAQQVALARALLLDPAVVILDEATAEAGTAGADSLDDAARELVAGRTTLLVAHRLDQARMADRVLVMGGGRIIEEGTHQQLVDSGGQYATMWSAWQKGRS